MPTRYMLTSLDAEFTHGHQCRRYRQESNRIVPLAFLKAMHALERITGGPVYLGVDVIDYRTPETAHELGDEFRLPIALDDWMADWRMSNRMIVKKPTMVY